MKRWLKIGLWTFASLALLTVVGIVTLIGIDRFQFERSLRFARSLSPTQIEGLMVEAQRLGATGTRRFQVLQISSTAFAGIPAKYLVVHPGRVDLVFYKDFEDQVSVQFDVEARRAHLVFPYRDGWRTELLWPQEPNKAPEPTPMSVTPPAAQESRRP